MLKLTKNELRNQQIRLSQFQKYLPTLQLKKAMLQFEVALCQMEVTRLHGEMQLLRHQVEGFASFLLDPVPVDVLHYADVLHVKKRYENVAGVEIPIFESIIFSDLDYSLFDTPIWTDRAIEVVRDFVISREKVSIAEEKKRALEKELRAVSIRVNLFEKILIPRSQENIKRIRIFLSDQQLAAVAQAKVAKKKIALKKSAS